MPVDALFRRIGPGVAPVPMAVALCGAQHTNSHIVSWDSKKGEDAMSPHHCKVTGMRLAVHQAAAHLSMCGTGHGDKTYHAVSGMAEKHDC